MSQYPDGVRDLTPEECKVFYGDRRCPFCAAPARDFLIGPRGGACVNLECPSCGVRLNVIDTARYAFESPPMFGQVIRAPRTNA